MLAGLHIECEEKKKVQIVHLAGRLDAANTPKLEQTLSQSLQNGEEKILLDFTKVHYLSSAGIRLLLAMTKKLSPSGGLKMYAMQTDVMEIIKMAGFERILEIYSSEKEALQAFS